jgi:hypothetical protein
MMTKIENELKNKARLKAHFLLYSFNALTSKQTRAQYKPERKFV